MGIFRRLKELITNWKRQRKLKKRMEELRKRDPFIYK